MEKPIQNDTSKKRIECKNTKKNVLKKGGKCLRICRLKGNSCCHSFYLFDVYKHNNSEARYAVSEYCEDQRGGR